MSRDIRSFFQPKKVPKQNIEDDDIIPDSPDIQIKSKKKEARKKRVLSDSEEEIFDSKKKKKCVDKNDKSKLQTTALKEVKASDIFGNGPVKRTEPIVKKEKVQKATETGIHSDDEFEKSLLELDSVEEVQAKIKPDVNETIHNNATSHNKEAKCDTKEKKSPHKIENNAKDKNYVKSKSNSTPHKSKADNEKKRKFTEFIDDSSNKTGNHEHIEEKSSKMKLNKKIKDEEQHEPMKNGIIKMDSDELNDSNIIENSINENTQGSSKKKRHNKSLNESVLTDEERHERRMHSAALYKQYLNRSGPKHLGSKEIPEGAANCLKECAFLLTGVLDSFERDEVTDAIVKYGGSIKNAISKKVTHVLAGEEPGPAKIEKARDLGIKIINEDEFLQMIRHSTKKASNEIKEDTKQDKSMNGKLTKDKLPKSLKGSDSQSTKGKPKDDKTPKKDKKSFKIEDKSKPQQSDVKSEDKYKKVHEAKENANLNEISNGNILKSCEDNDQDAPNLMWVDKYKPQNVKQIIGQHGEASNVKKLSNWLTKWYVNRKAKLPKPSPWAKNDDGGYYKAALLSGPPGVGKTTTVALVCKELGFDVVEFNASDTRSKNLIKEQITELLTTTSLSAYAKGDTGKQAVTKKHVLVMDEVDGMAGNEDRGGLQELIGLIKTTAVPIVCMCNDRNSQKMRSLVNYCYDLRFSRPRVDQIKAAMMSICFKEGLKMPPEALTQLVTAAQQDVRQTLHLLSVWAADCTRTAPDQLRRDAGRVHKDIRLGPWEAVRKVFTAEEHKNMTINDKSDLFFYDYSLAPLFVQENYLNVKPHCPKEETLKRVSEAADSISLGDLVDARIRGQQAWNLLPIQAMYSSVLPGHAMAGHLAAQVQFPAWLGRNSRRNKMHRLCQEIHAHTRLSTTGSKSSIFLDYSTHLRDAIVQPLIKDRSEGIARAMEVLESYHLLREDLDSLSELALWPGQTNPMVLVDSKVKAAMTRTYNKSSSALPYAPPMAKRARTRNDDGFDGDGDPDGDGEPDGDADDADDSDPEHDALIKRKKHEEPKAKQATKEKKEKKDKKKK